MMVNLFVMVYHTKVERWFRRIRVAQHLKALAERSKSKKVGGS